MVYPRQGGANTAPLIHREAYSLARGHTLLGVSRVLWAHNTVAVAREEAGVVVEVLSLWAGPRPSQRISGKVLWECLRGLSPCHI